LVLSLASRGFLRVLLFSSVRKNQRFQFSIRPGIEDRLKIICTDNDVILVKHGCLFKHICLFIQSTGSSVRFRLILYSCKVQLVILVINYIRLHLMLAA
jgi:hypothetical protein